MSEELKKIEERYSRRKNMDSFYRGSFMEKMVEERERVYQKFIFKKFKDVQDLKCIEIGAGQGSNIHFFKKIGFRSEHIFANELLPERLIELEKNHPDITIFAGDASVISTSFSFDVVFQSTVFTSILDENLRKKIAENMWKMLKPGGIILWYDFVYNNPSNPDVRKVSLTELKKLFPQARKMEFKRVTLAPPLARRVGFLYPIFNFFPFLRTHIVACIEKP